MQIIFDTIKEYGDIILLYSVLANLLALSMVFIQSMKLSKLSKKYKVLSTGIEGKNIEEIINHYYGKINGVEQGINKAHLKIEHLERQLKDCVQKLGIVRYDAFDDMGGEQSFSMALLDGQHNGFILTSIYHRNNNVVYGKPVKKGKTAHTLSVEELQALDRAKNNSLDEYGKMIS